jgi:PAS domain S-box-containing protein
MAVELIIFFASMILSGVMVIVLAKMRDSEIRDRRMKSFFPLGIIAFGWIVINAVTVVINPQYFAFVYSFKMIFVIIVPYLSAWFFLNFTESKLVESRLVQFIFITIPALDIVIMLTNPLHGFYFISFDYPNILKTSYYNIRVIIMSAVVLFSYVIIFRYIFKNFRQYPLLFLTGIGVIIPFPLNMLYAFNIIKLEHDVAPLCYFFTIIVFIYFANISRLDTTKRLTQALAEITKSSALSSGIVEESARIIVQEGCHALSANAIRVGIWNMSEDNAVIKNITYYDIATKKHFIKDDVDLSSCPEYLSLLKSERVILINDTSMPNPLSPIMDSHGPNICAMLDAPIRVAGKLVGVVCIEQSQCREFPAKREWTADEQNFVSSLADFMTIAISSYERRTIMRRVETMMSNLPGMVFQCLYDPPSYAFTFVSEGSQELIGYTPEELIGNSTLKFFEMVHPDDVESFKKLIAQTLSVGLSAETTYRIIMKDGSIKWIWERSRVVEFKEDGTPSLLEGFFSDVTEVRRLEAAELNNLQKLKEAEERAREADERAKLMKAVAEKTSILAAILDATPDLIFFKDADLRHTECNNALEKHLNMRKADIVGKNDAEAFNFPLDLVDHYAAKDKKVIAEKQILIVEETIPAADGRVLLFETIKSPIIDDGKAIGLVGISRDITHRKAAEESLNRQYSLMSTVNAAAAVLLEPETGGDLGAINCSMEMVCQSVGADRVYIWQIINKEDGRLYYRKICKWVHAEKTVDNSFLEISYDDTIPYSKSLLLEGKSVNGPVDTLPKTDREFLSSLDVKSILIVPLSFKGKLWGTVSFDDCSNCRSFPEADEQILRSWGLLVVGAIQRSEMMLDLEHAVAEAKKSSSDAEMAYAEAEAANHAKSAFLASVSHEIRTPMNAILGIAEIQLQNKLPTDTRNALNIIYNSGYTLLGIINDLLDLSKIEAGKLELVNNRYETASMISDTVNLNTARIGSKPIEFRLNVDSDLPFELIGDELCIRQILNNLLSNAFKYTDSGEISLSFSAQTSAEEKNSGVASVMLTIVVRDTGQGMTEDQIRSLFDAYTRFNMKTNRFVEGTGLGMNIVQHLVQKMNGKIIVNSIEGKGTEITVHLPQGYASSARLGKELAEDFMNFRLTNMLKNKKEQITREPIPYGKVLLVDDMETNLYVARGFLLPYGLTIDTALSGMDAVEKIEHGNVYDIVFMDHMMPVMDGIEATKIIRGKGYKQPIVALTANAVLGQEDMFMINGFDGFISKPIDIRELNASLNKFVRDRHPPEEVEAARASFNSEKVTVSNTLKVDPELAKVFSKEAKKAIAIMESYKDMSPENDLQAYIINAHSLKGALANIGETGLSGLAGNLEKAGREGKRAIIKKETPAFLARLWALVDRFKPDDAEHDTFDISDEDKEYLCKKLQTIKGACVAYDKKEAKDALTELKQKAWPGEYSNLLNTISEHLLHSDFDKAEALCSACIVEINSTGEGDEC